MIPPPTPSTRTPSLPSTLDSCHHHHSKPQHTCISHVHPRQPAQLERHETNHIRPRPHPVSTHQLNAIDTVRPLSQRQRGCSIQTSNTSIVPRETQLSCLGGPTQRTKLTCCSDICSERCEPSDQTDFAAESRSATDIGGGALYREFSAARVMCI